MSRTATAEWKQIRRRVIREAIDAGLTNCPLCRRWLDYVRAQRPNSAEVDHVEPFAVTGTNDGVLRVICRACNQRLGGVLGNQRMRAKKRVPSIDFRA